MRNQQSFSLKFISLRLRAIFTTKAALLALAMVLSNTATISAGEIVTIETPEIQQSAFKIRRVEAQGITLEPTPGITLSGILSVPEGDGPHPAVVLLPESVEARHSYVTWADYLTENDLVVSRRWWKFEGGVISG